MSVTAAIALGAAVAARRLAPHPSSKETSRPMLAAAAVQTTLRLTPAD